MSEYDDWSGELGRLAESIAPIPGATALVHEQVRRRQRRRAVVAVLASAAAVAAVAGTGFALSRPSAVAPAGPAPTSTVTQDSLFSCPTGIERINAMSEHPAVIPDLEHQTDVIAAIDAQSWSAFTVRFRAPSLLGVMALVDGDLDAARRVLGQESVQIVYSWQPWMDDGNRGLGLVQQVMQWQLDPAVAWARHQFMGIDGYAGIAIWPEAAQVVVQWKAPLPEEIQRLPRIMPNGVEIVVTPVNYSEADFQRAGNRVFRASREGEIHNLVTSSTGCADGSGLIVGIDPPVLDRAALQQQLSELTGVPVMVVEQPPMHAG